MPDSPQLVSLADKVEIAPGVLMNRLGLGTYRAEEGAEVENEVASSISAGYRLFDTAAVYGNERGVGEALRESGIPREELFVTTKVWNTDQGFEPTLAAFDRSLTALGTGYVDLYLVHWPRPSLMSETWRAMEEILASGRTRAIGVCNHLPHHLNQLLRTAKVQPAVDQFEFHPRLQQPELVAHCRSHGITIQAWAPVMRGRVNLIPELVEIAQRHDKTPAQVSIRWILEQGITTIPKSVHSDRIRENADIYDFELSEEEIARIARLDAGQRIGPDPDHYA